MQEELKPLEFPTNLADVREEMERQIAQMFHNDAALLSGDPFGEPSYVEAEMIRRKSMQELRRRLEDEISR